MKIIYKRIIRSFLLGVFTLVPITLTFWLIWILLTSTDRIFERILLQVLPPSMHWPGLGLFAALTISLLVGIGMQATALPRLVRFLEKIIFSVPLIKTVYGAFKDFSDFLSGHKKKKSSKMVMVRIPNSEHRILGVVTQELPSKDLGVKVKDKLLVYFPMSYQIGGYALLVDKSEVEPLELSMDEAMRYILTAGISTVKH